MISRSTIVKDKINTEEASVFSTISQAIILLRPKQWTKNIFIFAGLIFSQNLFNMHLLISTAVAFIVFCMLSSAGYIINDIFDVEQDRKHPVKKFRPIAAKRIKKGQALTGAFILLFISFFTAWALNFWFLTISLGYFVLVFSYSYWLKHMVILDVFAIASGFLMRAVAGAVVINVHISPWFFICTLLLALFLALTKRRYEYVALENNGMEHRQVLEHYSLGLLDQLISTVTASTILAYSLYTFTSSMPDNLIITIPFVIYGIFRYLYLVHKKNMGSSPEEILLYDKPMLVNLMLWLFFVIAVIYT